MKKLFLSLLLSIFVLLSQGSQQSVAAPPANFQTNQIVGSGLDGPSGFDFAPDGRIFILERTGAVKIYKNGQLLSQPFTTFSTAATGDRGLIGIAFDPDFNTNHYVYFYYTGSDEFNRLVRFDATGDVANGNPHVLYQTPQQSTQLHVGGTIRFGPDGKLYFSVGDNGNSTNAQNLSNPHGKILRINKDGTIPPDNPFVGQAGKLPEIWAYGFRNPFRFTIDFPTNRIYTSDVGEATWEEINFVQKGANYGWPICEGTCSTAGMVNPIYTYNHDGLGSAALAGPVYRHTMFPSPYQGSLFIGDYARGFIKRLTLDASGNSTGVVDFDTNAGSVVDMKMAADGSLYYVTYFPGVLYRITFSTDDHTPVANATANVTKGDVPLTVNFSSSGSFDPDSDPITFLWDLGDGTTTTAANPTKTYTVKGTYIVQLTVSDGTNSAQAVPIVIQVGQPPNVIIAEPNPQTKYNGGDTISYVASGTDAAGHDLPDSAFETEVIFHHNTHIHPFYGPVTGKSGQFTIPRIGESTADTWLEIKVTATDTNNLSTTKTVELFPNVVTLNFQTSPANLQILLDDAPTNTPLTTDRVVGFEKKLSVVPIQQLGTKMYEFKSWSDGGAVSHKITIPPTTTTYIATFVEVPPFTAQYFNNRTLTGSPALTRQDLKIDFDWGGGSPAPQITADNFSARWQKTQYFAAGTYKFTTITDDGVRLYIDNNLVVDNWADQGPTPYQAVLNLAEGDHAIKMEYFENGGGAVAKLFWEVSESQTPPPPTETGGLTGDYFNNIDFTAKALTRVDPTVNFDWGSGSPDPTIGADTYSIRWTGQIQPSFTEPYIFYTSSDDGVRLWINDLLVIDKWQDQGETEWTHMVDLVANQKYNIKMEYFENGGGASAKLRWASPSTPKQIIPQSALFPTATQASTTYTAQYWNTPTQGSKPTFPTTPPTLVRQEAEINMDTHGSPDPAITNDHFMARWTRDIDFEAGTYVFTTTVDDGVRIYIDNALVIDKWQDQGATTFTHEQALSAGIHSIKVEYYENGGGAVAKFSYEKKTTTTTNGLLANYFDNINFTNLVLTRTDPTIDFFWDHGSPSPAIAPDTFSTRWTGKIKPQFTQTYTFYSSTDDGVRVWINGQLIIDKWIDQPNTEWAGTISLNADQLYDIKVEYFENGGGAVARLSWSSASQPKQIIPNSRFFLP